MILFEVCNLQTSGKWDEFLENFPIEKRDIYFTPQYYQIYENNGEGKATCLIYKDGKEIALYPFLKNSINDLGFSLDKDYFDIQGAYGYNGMIVTTEDKTFIKNVNKTFSEYLITNNVIAEFTRFHPLLKNESFSRGYLNIIEDRKTVVLDLGKEYPEVWERQYSSGNRNMVRKAERNGYGIQILKKPEQKDIRSFIDIYYTTMRSAKAIDYYFFKTEYFSNLFSFLKDQTFLINIFDPKNEIVCSSIFMQYGDYFHYHLSGRTSKTDNSVNNYLLDKAVVLAIENGAKYFHFGGGRTTAKDDSLLKFKMNFSRNVCTFYIGKRIFNAGVYKSVVSQWESKNPDKADEYKNVLLKYRY